ncbi:MAG: alpha/beta hydrolase [Myxococcota bacterium]
MTNARPLELASNGMRFPALEAGPADGPVVLCLHGFPDTWHGWFEGGDASFGARLAAAGFRVVAPAMRGVTPLTLPTDGDYSPFALAKDAIGHAEALGGRVHVVGHDWGALTAYMAAAQAPERFARMVTLGIPHPLALKPTPALLWHARHFVTFQFAARAARWLRKDDFSGVAKLYRRWSPTWRFPASALDDVKAAYAVPGIVEGAIAPYKAMARHRKAALEVLRATKIAVPTLALGGAGDPGVPTAAYARSARGFGAEYRWDMLPVVGHFVQREDPAGSAERVLAFFRS